MKRLLSLILALTLIISVAPMSFADDVANEPIDEPGMYFNFNAAAFGEKKDITAADIKENGDSTAPIFATEGTDPWYIDGQRLVKDFVLTSATPDATAYPDAKPNALHWQVNKSYASNQNNAGGTLVLRVKINETGVFTPSITYEGRLESNRYSFFLAPVSSFTTSKTGYKFYEKSDGTGTNGDLNITNKAPLLGCYGTPNAKLIKLGQQQLWNTTSITKPVKFAPVEIKEPGDYYLYIASNGRYDNKPYSNVSIYKMNLYSLHLTPVPAKDLADKAFTAKEDPDYTSTNSASVTRLAYYGDDVAAETIGDVTTVNYGESLTIDGAEKTVTKDDKTYNFSYWAKGLNTGVGNKQILSTALSFDYKPSEGTNYLIAVYEEEGNAEEAFYNYNGQLLTDLSIGEDGNLPELPAMAGLGNAIGWEQLGTGVVFEAGVEAPATGDKVFMAKYDEPAENITINEESFAYGDVVSCEDIVDNFDAATFSYWTRTIGIGKEEIMSIDPDYSFSAYTDCTIKAVCNGNVELANPRKIALSTFKVNDNLTAVMAEFIGFTTGVKEKGIMFDGQKIAMTTDKAQFTVTNDTAAAVTVTGYAIVDEGGTTVKYTDGSISVPGATAE